LVIKGDLLVAQAVLVPLLSCLGQLEEIANQLVPGGKIDGHRGYSSQDQHESPSETLYHDANITIGCAGYIPSRYACWRSGAEDRITVAKRRAGGHGRYRQRQTEADHLSAGKAQWRRHCHLPRRRLRQFGDGP